MIFYIIKRLVYSLPAIIGVCTLSFFLIHLTPGDPIDIMLGEQAQSIDKQQLQKELGLDLPLSQQYVNYLTKLVRFDLGETFLSQKPVAPLIAKHLPATIELALGAIFVALLIAIPLGVYSAAQKNSSLDKLTLLSSVSLYSLPSFFLGPLLIWLLALKFPLFPVSDRQGFSSLILPSLTLGIPMAAFLTRMTRASVLEQLNQQYAVVAAAKGLHKRTLYFKHILRNALTPIITILGLQMGSLLTGSVITESIFDWPGLGTLLLQAVNQRDYPLFQACVLVIALIYISVNLLTDIAYAYSQPQIKEDQW